MRTVLVVSIITFSVGNKKLHIERSQCEKALARDCIYGHNSLKISAPHPLIKNYVVTPLSVRSILLDSTFKYRYIIVNVHRGLKTCTVQYFSRLLHFGF
jgi:hypothetical protein